MSKNAQVMMTVGVQALPHGEKTQVLRLALDIGLDENPEPSFFVLDPGCQERKVEDGGATVRCPFNGRQKVYIKKDDYGNVPPEYKEGVKARFVVTCLLPEEY